MSHTFSNQDLSRKTKEKTKEDASVTNSEQKNSTLKGCLPSVRVDPKTAGVVAIPGC